MARKRSEFLSALGKLFEIFKAFVDEVIARGGSDEDIARILTDKILRRKMVDLLVAGRNTCKFPIWKTITLGIHKSPNEYRAALNEAGHRIDIWANDILNKVDVSAKETEVGLINLSVAELGFKGGAHYKDIYARAIELGLELCPAEVGPTLRLQYTDQPRGEWLRVAMEAIPDSDGSLGVFLLVRDGNVLWLSSSGGYPGSFWLGPYHFLFVRRK